MTKSNRIGHWRTNKHGTTTWVTEHTVEKTVYTVSKNGSEKYVNGQKLLNTYCNYCYKKVFFISLNENKRLFNNDSEPLIVHKCRNRNTNIEVNDKPTQTKKFLDEDDLKALNRRGEALRQKSELRKEERRIKRDKQKAAKKQKKEINRDNLNKANEKVVAKAFFISGGKKQSQRLKQIAIGNVNKYLPKIIHHEIKSFLELIQNEESSYLRYNIPTKSIINSKKRMLTLLSNAKIYSENLEYISKVLVCKRLSKNGNTLKKRGYSISGSINSKKQQLKKKFSLVLLIAILFEKIKLALWNLKK